MLSSLLVLSSCGGIKCGLEEVGDNVAPNFTLNKFVGENFVHFRLQLSVFRALDSLTVVTIAEFRATLTKVPALDELSSA